VARQQGATAWVFLPPAATGELEKWHAPKRAAAIARIVKAVGIPPNNEMRLASDIHRAHLEHPAYGKSPVDLVLVEGSAALERLKKVRRIRKNVEKQAGLIDSDHYINATINQFSTPFGIPPAQQLLLMLRNVEKALEWLAKEWRTKADLPANLKERRPSQREWLAGVSLPLVFERHFRRRAGRSRQNSKPSSPTVRFVEATLNELGMPYAKESIIRAISRLKPQLDIERTKKGMK
jgi:hypothetical protein